MAAARGSNGEAAPEGVRLLGGRMSPFTMRARMALALRGVEYELVEERFHPRKSDRLLAANPVYGKIPVLLLPDGRAICESAVIAQYVDEAWGGAGARGILPEDPYERAMHRFWTVYIDDKFWPSLDAISLGPTQEARATATANTRASLKILEEAFAARSNGRAFFSGTDASPGLLDVALGCFLPALWACERLNGLCLLDVTATPLLRAWSERLAATPAAEAVLPETEEVVAFTRFLQTKFGVAVSE